MSELSKLLESKLPVANPANLANPHPEISNFSNFSRGARPKTHFDRQSVQSVDALRGKLLRERRSELRRAAGDDWEVLYAPAKIIGFADSLATEQIREGGSVPDHYTGITKCKRCGPVPIFPRCPPQVNGCPWCFNRIKALPMPMRRDAARGVK